MLGYYEGRLWIKCSTRRFVMAFHPFGTPILVVDSLFSEFDSSNRQFDSAFYEVDLSFCEVLSSTFQFDSSAGVFDSSFYKFDSSLTTSVRRCLSLCRFVVSLWRLIVSTSPLSEAIIRLTLHEWLLDSMHSCMRYLSIICSLQHRIRLESCE